MTIVDALGATITMMQPPKRIITMAPSLTEAVFALGLGDRLVGVTDFCKYPPAALKKEKIGGYINPSQEKIMALQPDLILATRGTPLTFIEALRRSGLTVIAVEQTSFEQITASLELIGRVTGAGEAGKRLAEELRETRRKIEARTARLRPAQRPRALFVLSLQPLFVTGRGSYLSEMLVACGAREVSGLEKPFGPLAEEAAVAADPEVLVFPSSENGRPVTAKQLAQRLRASPVWRNISAVKTGRIVVLPTEHVSVPGPRLKYGLRELAQALHPELFPR